MSYMSEILGVKFRPNGKIYYFSSNELNCQVNDHVIAETSYGVAFGKIVKIIDDKSKIFLDDQYSGRYKDDFEIKPIIRVATKKDVIQNELNKKKADEARKICLKKIKKYDIKMRIIDVEYTFDRKKILFYFSADGKVDFRVLVRDLASVLKVRIELRQIGVRDQSKILGGLGVCGQPFCCHSFLNDFGVVSIKMAKEQGLSLNPIKLSGNCGRLMCCLQYEQSAYNDLIKTSPKIGDVVSTVDGVGEVVDINLITGFVKVVLNTSENNNVLPQIYHKKDVKIVNGK